MAEQMLSVEGIHTYYGESHVLQGVSLHVDEGEAVALLGRNGVGKSTTINSIIGFTPPRRGRIRVRGEDVTHAPSHRTAQMGVGLVPQGRGIFPTLTVEENVTLAARNAKNGGWTFERVMEAFPLLEARLDNRGSQLSGGEQQMLAIARALMTNPELLLLDEPSEGLAPMVVREIQRIMHDLRERGLSLLLVEQNLALAFSVADRVYVMNKGQIVFEGTPAELQESEEILHRYLGV
ncbi:MAG: ABC transporter ATP-binding protein [Candidatus Promineifilaceae bacterium]|nr:ABC transporter ATP-binding protein [Candidatus Promineifilaceae bacterium]